MRERFTYEIANWLDGRWNVTLIRESTFSRDAASIARSLLEQWIVGHARELAGGTRVFVYAGRNAGRSAPQHLAATVRIRVFSGSLTVRDADPVAVAYLADAKSDYSGDTRHHQVSA